MRTRKLRDPGSEASPSEFLGRALSEVPVTYPELRLVPVLDKCCHGELLAMTLLVFIVFLLELLEFLAVRVLLGVELGQRCQSVTREGSVNRGLAGISGIPGSDSCRKI